MNMGAFGENFPYTNFHDLNLDWIVKVIKYLNVKYPNIVEELNKKLNAPELSPHGFLNDILYSNGNGTTRWDKIDVALGGSIADAVMEWLDEHPEATTTVQDNSLTLKKLTPTMKAVVTAPLSFEYTSYARKTVYNSGFLSDKSIQSICYDSTREKFIVGCSVNETTDESRLIILDSDDLNDINRVVELNMGHCNDMKYEPSTDTLFIATGTELLLLNAETFSVKNRVSFADIEPWQFAIMPDGSYFVSDETEARIYNSDFTNYTQYATNLTRNMANYMGIDTADIIMQSAVILYDTPYVIYNVLQADGNNYYKTIFASIKGNDVVGIKSCYNFNEVEGATVVGDSLYIVFGQNYVGIGRQNLNFSILPDDRVLSVLPNTDLNDYLIPGVYMINSASVAASLGHIPYDAKYSGGRLIVEKANAYNIRQTLVMEVWGWGEQIYTRGYNGNFFDWYRLSMRKATTDEQGRYVTQWIITNGILTDSKKAIQASLPLNEVGSIEFAGFYVKAIAESQYLIGSSANADNLDNPASNYTYTLTNAGNGSYEVKITKKDDSAFATTNNNIPAILIWSAYYKLV